MRLLSVAMTASLIMAGLIGCASSHTRARHVYAYPKHAYSGAVSHRHAYPHVQAHARTRERGHRYGERHVYKRIYRPPPPIPGRTPDGRYVLPGGLESVCAGGTPPPCQ